MKSINTDLHTLVFENVSTKTTTIEAKQMPAHSDAEPWMERPEWVFQHNIAGNNQADRLAGFSAVQMKSQIDNDTAWPIL